MRWLLLGMVGVLVLGMGCVAVAQIPPPETQGLNYSFSAGAAFLTSSAMNNSTSPMVSLAWFDQAGDAFGQNSMFGLTGDWIGVRRNDGKFINVVPVMFNYRQYGIISSWRVFVTLGVGVLGVTDSINDMQLNNGANFCWSAGVGFDVTNNLLFNARFIGGQNPGNDGLAGVQLGYRF